MTEPAFSTWFVCRNGSPLIYVTAEGALADRKGHKVDLFAVYQRLKSVDAVVAGMSAAM